VPEWNFCLAQCRSNTFLTGKVDSLKEGVLMARTVMERGSVRQKIDEFIRISNNL
jgi:anthranilate phosphoribosyltransferase